MSTIVFCSCLWVNEYLTVEIFVITALGVLIALVVDDARRIARVVAGHTGLGISVDIATIALLENARIQVNGSLIRGVNHQIDSAELRVSGLTSRTDLAVSRGNHW
jgi:uncharacterized membrane protein YqjE